MAGPSIGVFIAGLLRDLRRGRIAIGERHIVRAAGEVVTQPVQAARGIITECGILAVSSILRRPQAAIVIAIADEVDGRAQGAFI